MNKTAGWGAPVCLAGTEEWTMTSRCKDDYLIMAAIPKEPPPIGGYPVIYALDGDAVFGTLAETARLQMRKLHGYDPAIVIAIAYPSREPFDMQRRCRDFTMPADKRALPVRPGGMEWPENGGADAFITFLESELFTEVTKRYPVDNGRRTIFGHSLGGLFVLHALFTRPGLFRCYAAGSPSIWWNNQAILQEASAFLAANPPGGPPSDLLMLLGGDEHPFMLADANQLQRLLGSSTPFGFKAELVVFPGEGHVSVLPAALSRTVRFALEQR